MAVIKSGYEKFADLINWFTEKENYPVLRNLMSSKSEYKVVYIPDASVELTPDHLVFAKTIIYQNIGSTYHTKNKVYLYIQCKWCRHISRARFIRHHNAADVRPYWTLYSPLTQDKCQHHWGSYDKEPVVNTPSTAIVIDDDDDDNDSAAAAAAPTRCHRRRRIRMKYTAPRAKPYWKPTAAVAPAAVVPAAEPYDREEEPQAQNIISVSDISSEEEEEEE